MLDVYKTLFNKLNEHNVCYCIYKGFSHLEKDLSGARGDIDIIISPEHFLLAQKLFLESGFVYVRKSSDPHCFFCLDISSFKMAKLDTNSHFLFGPKPCKPYRFYVAPSKLKKYETNGIKLLHYDDYIPLTFLHRVTAANPTKEHLSELQCLLNNYTPRSSYISEVLCNCFKLDCSQVLRTISECSSWSVLQLKYKAILNRQFKNYNLKLFIRRWKQGLGMLKAIARKILKFPQYSIRKKGYLVAFIGVDGAGKTSTIDFLMNLEYFKLTGIKTIYFGDNQYWIPFLGKLMQAICHLRWASLVLGPLGSIDRQLRLFITLYHMWMGNIVLADRYYYDDLIARNINRNESRPKLMLKKIYRKIFGIKIIRKPDLTIFLDVSPDIAYQRKQDYDYATMLVIHKAYKDFISKMSDACIINANQPKNMVYHEVSKNIIALDQREIVQSN